MSEQLLRATPLAALGPPPTLLPLQVLRARQSELQRCGQHTLVLLWQRASMPAILGLAELIADTLATCNCLAPGAKGTNISTAPAPPPYLIINDLKKILMELLSLASSWMRDGIAAVCGIGAGAHSSGEVTAAGAAAGASSVPGVDLQEAMLIICQVGGRRDPEHACTCSVLGCQTSDAIHGSRMLGEVK